MSDTSKLSSVAQDWKEFSAKTMPKLVPGEPQYEDMKVAFYAGTFCLFLNLNNLAHPSIPEEEGSKYLKSLADDMSDFVDLSRQAIAEAIAQLEHKN